MKLVQLVPMSRIFLSHSSNDNFEAVALRDWLALEGWQDVFLDLDPVRGIEAGQRWERRLHEAASRCEAVVFLVSAHWLASDWCVKEYTVARRLNKKLFAVLVDPGKTIKDLPASLTDTWQVVDLVGGQDMRLLCAVLPNSHEERHIGFSRDGLTRLRRGLQKAGLDQRFFAWPPEGEPQRAPYRGLRPLEAADAGVFFGRDAPIVEATDRLRGLGIGAPPRLMVILGASGAGKSSFLRAGLLPRLARDDTHFVALTPIRPERAAITGESGLLRALEIACPTKTRAELRSAIQAGVTRLRPIFAELAQQTFRRTLAEEGAAKPPAVVVAIDQAEELFHAEGSDEGQALLGLVRDLVVADDLVSVIVIFAIRSDSYDALEHAKTLEGLRQDTIPLLPMPRGAYKEVIEGPADRVAEAAGKLVIEPQLTERLLADIEAGGGNDALPLLAFTLEQLYLEYYRAGVLRLADYEAIGGLGGAIDRAVARAFARADADPRIPRERKARELLLRRGLIPWLCGVDPDTKSPRRNIARLADIPLEAAPLINLLVEERLLSTDTQRGIDAITRQDVRTATIEPTHEALLRQWALLDGWLAEDFGLLATLESLKRAARDWEGNALADAWLAHQGQRLAEAQSLDARPDLAAKLDTVEREYLMACRKREEAVHAEIEKRRSEREAEQERRIVDAQALTNATRRTAQRTRIGLLVAILLAIAAVGFGLLAKGQKTLADVQAINAKKQRIVAEQAEAVARQEKTFAEQQKEIADQRTIEAKAQRDAAGRSETIAKQNAASATAARRDELVADADRVAALAQQLANADNVNLAAAVALSATPSAPSDDRPITSALAAALLRTIGLTDLPVDRNLVDNALTLALSPDGNTLAAGTANGTVVVFDAIDMRERFRFKASSDWVTDLEFSPDGQRMVVTGSAVPTVWDAAGKKLVELTRPHATSVTESAGFSPNGNRIVVGTAENRAIIYDGLTGRLLFELPGSSFDEMLKRLPANTSKGGLYSEIQSRMMHKMYGVTTDVTFSPDGKLVAATGQPNPDGSVRLFDSTSGTLVRILTGGIGSMVVPGAKPGRTLRFSRDGSTVVAAPLGRSIKIWDVATGRLKADLPSEGVQSFILTPDGRAIISGQYNGAVITRCIETDAQVMSFQAHTTSIDTLVSNDDGTVFATGARDGTARLWRMPSSQKICTQDFDLAKLKGTSQRPLATLDGNRGAISDIKFSLRDSAIFTSSQDGHVRKWSANAKDGVALQFPESGSERKLSTSYVISADGQYLYITDCRCRVPLSGSVAKTFDFADSFASGPPGSAGIAFATPWVFEDLEAAGDATFHFWPGDKSFDHLFEYSPDGSRVILHQANNGSYHDDPTWLYDRISKQKLATLNFKDRHHPDLTMFSPDGTRLIGVFDQANQAGSLVAWNSRTGERIAESEHVAILSAYGSTIDLSSDGTKLLLFGDNGNVALYDVGLSGIKPSQTNITDFSPGRNRTSVALSPDARWFAVGHSDGFINVVPIQHPDRGDGVAQSFDTRGAAIMNLEVSDDGRFLAASDDGNTVWIFDLARQALVRSEVEPDTVMLLRFTPDSRHLVIGDQRNHYRSLPVEPEIGTSSDPLFAADWARAVRLATVREDDYRRYNLQAAGRVRRPDLEAIKPLAIPPKRLSRAEGVKVAACDRLADNPYDRDRRTPGIMFDEFDASAAKPMCDAALLEAPDDLETRYHLARIEDRLGHGEAAMTKYSSLADQGYSAAMRGIARLLASNAAKGTDSATAEQWYEKAALAGDTVSMLNRAGSVALEGDETRFGGVLSMMAGVGIENRASAALAVFINAAKKAKDDSGRVAALELGMLGLLFADTVNDPAPIQYPDDRAIALELVRELSARLPPRAAVRAYRDAQAWHP